MTRIRKKGKDETLRKKIIYIYKKGGGGGGEADYFIETSVQDHFIMYCRGKK